MRTLVALALLALGCSTPASPPPADARADIIVVDAPDAVDASVPTDAQDVPAVIECDAGRGAGIYCPDAMVDPRDPNSIGACVSVFSRFNCGGCGIECPSGRYCDRDSPSDPARCVFPP